MIFEQQILKSPAKKAGLFLFYGMKNIWLEKRNKRNIIIIKLYEIVNGQISFHEDEYDCAKTMSICFHKGPLNIKGFGVFMGKDLIFTKEFSCAFNVGPGDTLSFDVIF
jgi:hypothetical protein